MNSPTFFATTPKGIEALLAAELRRLGAASVRETRAGVAFEGDLAVAYRACLWSRLANRILLPVARFAAAAGRRSVLVAVRPAGADAARQTVRFAEHVVAP